MEKDIEIKYDFHIKYEGVETIGIKNYYKVSTKGLLCDRGKELAQIDYLYLEKKENKYKIIFSEIKHILHSIDKFPLFGVDLDEFLTKIETMMNESIKSMPNKKIESAKTVMRRKEKKYKKERRLELKLNKGNKMVGC